MLFKHAQNQEAMYIKMIAYIKKRFLKRFVKKHIVAAAKKHICRAMPMLVIAILLWGRFSVEILAKFHLGW